MSDSMPLDPALAPPVPPADSPAASLGGNVEVPHHPLSSDPPSAGESGGGGFWAMVDRIVFSAADYLNPILIKEARESLKSRQFLITFFLLLAATVAWTVIGITFNAPEVYYLPSGPNLLYGYYFLMAIPIFGLVPLAAFRSLSSELDGDTFELLSITRLGSGQIVRGKFASACLQMLLYLAAVVPSLAFTYLLRGVGLFEIAMVIGIVIVTGLVIASFALMIAPMMSGVIGQSFAILILIGVILFAQFVVGGITLSGVIGQRAASTAEGWFFMVLTSVISLSFVVLFLKAAAAQIAPATENRSTPIRIWALVQQILWAASLAAICEYYDEYEALNFASMMIAAYWLIMGTLFLCETKELSPRVRRGLPSTFATRALLGPLSPGPSAGYVFAICSGVMGIMTLGAFGSMTRTGSISTEPVMFSAVMAGYLMGYLGLVRLLTLPVARKQPVPLAMAVCVLLLVIMVAAFLPSIITVATQGELPSYYQDIEIIDWAWTSAKAFESGGLPEYLGVIAFLAGSLITLVNLWFMADLYAYAKVTVPQRVLSEEAT